MRSRGVVTATLGLTQILAWGSTYYLPAVLAVPIAADTGWPGAWIVAGLSLGLISAALVSPHVGRIVERQGGRTVLAGSAAAIGAGQIGLALSPSLPAFLAAWAVMGLGMGAGLYDAAFATLGRLYGHDARRAITTLTLFGGFASTLCWPLSAFLVSWLGWRGACGVYALIQFAVATPLYLFVLPSRVPTRVQPGEAPAHPSVSPAPARTWRLLPLLAATITFSAALSATLSVLLLPILAARGATVAEAVAYGACVGPAQVAARAIEAAIARYHHPLWTKLTSVAAVAVGIVALGSGAPVLAALAAYGAGIGLESIARGTVPLALFGPLGYAVLMGRLAMLSLAAQAGAPWLGALLMERAGSGAALAVLAVGAVVNVALTVALLLAWRGLGKDASSAAA